MHQSARKGMNFNFILTRKKWFALNFFDSKSNWDEIPRMSDAVKFFVRAWNVKNISGVSEKLLKKIGFPWKTREKFSRNKSIIFSHGLRMPETRHASCGGCYSILSMEKRAEECVQKVFTRSVLPLHLINHSRN